MTRAQRNIPAAIALIFVAPLVAEFLLGDLSIRVLVALVPMAPMYGGGALLIRELVRRTRRGWSAILLLGAAYSLIEEGFTTQSLFNPDYLHLHMHFLALAWIPFLHTGAWWTLFMLNLHTFWSISVSIALVEALVPLQADTPWLGPIGDAIVALLFLIGCVAGTRITLHQDPFIAPAAQLIAAAVLSLLLIVLAFLTPRVAPHSAPGVVPSPWITGAIALVLGFSVLVIPPLWGWGAFSVMLAIDIAFLVMIYRLSRRAAWTPLHILSLAAGGAFAYGIHAFMARVVFGGTDLVARIGNGVFLAAAVTVVFFGVRNIHQARTSQPQPASQ
ncbi:MAG TPA: hypothetical protein VHZ09_19485 [Acidobacteriaceae bacterium]|jgi:hypothetical protein|nr:hypothetical protein [Acidobacteriaceae bacterium]